MLNFSYLDNFNNDSKNIVLRKLRSAGLEHTSVILNHYIISDFLFNEVNLLAEEYPDMLPGKIQVKTNEFIARSFFISMYSEFEYTLLSICKIYEENLKLSNFHNYGGSKIQGIFKCINYLEHEVGIQNLSTSKEWTNEVSLWNVVRNSLVHNGGRINQSRSKKKLKRAIEQFNLLIISTELQEESIIIQYKDIKRVGKSLQDLLNSCIPNQVPEL